METYLSDQVGSGCPVKTYVWKPMTHRWTVSVRSKRTYVSFLFCVKRITQLPLQELNFITQFNFSLDLPDIIANKTLGESALSGKFFFQSYVSKLFASTPCLGDLAFLFFIFFCNCFSSMSPHGKNNLFPRSCFEFHVRPVADEYF